MGFLMELKTEGDVNDHHGEENVEIHKEMVSYSPLNMFLLPVVRCLTGE